MWGGWRDALRARWPGHPPPYHNSALILAKLYKEGIAGRLGSTIPLEWRLLHRLAHRLERGTWAFLWAIITKSDPAVVIDSDRFAFHLGSGKQDFLRVNWPVGLAALVCCRLCNMASLDSQVVGEACGHLSGIDKGDHHGSGSICGGGALLDY
jgi:hypothetical protein